jgi:hypothetical protein
MAKDGERKKYLASLLPVYDKGYVLAKRLGKGFPSRHRILVVINFLEQLGFFSSLRRLKLFGLRDAKNVIQPRNCNHS